MIEVTLGAVIAALIAKAIDRAGDRTLDQGEGALRRLVEAVRGRLSGASQKDRDPLEQVEDDPTSKRRIEALAALLDSETKRDAEFRRELSELVEEVRDAGVNIDSTVQVTYGSQSPQFANTSDSHIEINYGGKGDADRPRRISD